MSVDRFTSSETVLSESDTSITDSLMGRKQSAMIFQMGRRKAESFLDKEEMEPSVAKTRKLVEWICVALLILYHCNITKGKDLSGSWDAASGRQTTCYLYVDIRRYCKSSDGLSENTAEHTDSVQRCHAIVKEHYSDGWGWKCVILKKSRE